MNRLLRWVEAALLGPERFTQGAHAPLASTGGRTLREFSRLSEREQNQILFDYYTAGKPPEWVAAFRRALSGKTQDNEVSK